MSPHKCENLRLKQQQMMISFDNLLCDKLKFGNLLRSPPQNMKKQKVMVKYLYCDTEYE